MVSAWLRRGCHRPLGWVLRPEMPLTTPWHTGWAHRSVIQPRVSAGPEAGKPALRDIVMTSVLLLLMWRAGPIKVERNAKELQSVPTPPRTRWRVAGMADDRKKAPGQGEGLEEETGVCVCRGGCAEERAWTLEQRGGVQRGEPLRAEVCGAGGGSGQCPASILKCSQLGPRGAAGMRLSAQQTLPQPESLSQLWRLSRGGIRDPSSTCPCQHSAGSGGFMQEAAPGVPGERRQRFEAGPASGLTPLWAWSGHCLAPGWGGAPDPLCKMGGVYSSSLPWCSEPTVP